MGVNVGVGRRMTDSDPSDLDRNGQYYQLAEDHRQIKEDLRDLVEEWYANSDLPPKARHEKWEMCKELEKVIDEYE